jgi:4-amino-4-deoxy-L-arabinose transferase-like glycosyltransferase
MKRAATASALYLLPALIVGVGAGTIATIAGFDGLYGQDPFAYFDYAVGPLRESLARGRWPPPFFWPPGYPLIVALAATLTGPTPIAGQIVSLSAGMVVPLLTAWLCRELLPPANSGSRDGLLASVPIVSGLVAACSGQLWQLSVAVMSDTTALASATFGAAAVARYVRTGRGRWIVAAAAGLAWAVMTRWAYAVVAVPCSVCAVVALVQHRPGVALRHAAAAAVVAATVLLPAAGPALVQAAGRGGETTLFIGDLQVVPWHPINALRHEFVNVDGYLRYRLRNGVYYAVAPARWFFFTPILAPFVLLGAVAILRARAVMPTLLLISWPFLVFALVAGIPWQNPRFALPALPPLAILVAAGVDDLSRRAGKRIRALLNVVLLAGLVWMAVGAARLTQTFADRKADALATVRWTEERVPARARLVTFALTHTFRHYSRLATLELFELDRKGLQDLAADPRPTFLLIDIDTVEAQWRGRPPSDNYGWLRDGPGLVEVGRRGEVTLFRVSRAR